jgi:hypothetical protein
VTCLLDNSSASCLTTIVLTLCSVEVLAGDCNDFEVSFGCCMPEFKGMNSGNQYFLFRRKLR